MDADLEAGIHDHWVYGQAVDHEKGVIVLYTIFPHVTPSLYVDVIFEAVVVHHFEQQNVGGQAPAVVLFDITEEDPYFILNPYTTLLQKTKNYWWPMSGYTGIDDLVTKLTAGGAKCFNIHGTCGIHGFVFAKSMSLRKRTSRASVTDV